MQASNDLEINIKKHEAKALYLSIRIGKIIQEVGKIFLLQDF